MEAIITIKNYRCFVDSKPLVIKLKNGFIALVGQNNSGKSSFLKLFYELRALWRQLQAVQKIAESIRGEGYRTGVSYLDLYDPLEIFTDNNNRPISLEIEIISSNSENENYLSHVRITSERSDPNSWNLFPSYGPGKTSIEKGQDAEARSDELYIPKGDLHINCSYFTDLMKKLSNCLYVGPFRNAITEGTGNHYDLTVGTSFINTWNNWKTGNIKENNKRINEVVADIRNIFSYKSLEINSSEDKKTLQIVIDDKPYKLKELGAGITQFIIVLGNAAIKKPSFILIDEPELNLHPSLQIDFLTSLASYATDGILFATHSIGLARTTSEQIYSFQKTDKYSEVNLFEQTPNYTEFVGELSFSSYKEMGFDKILLVEGVKDVKTFQQFLRKLKKDHQIVIIPLGGNQLARGEVELELNELKRITNNIFSIVDSERDNEGSHPSSERKKFEEICKKLEINVCVTKRRAIENYFSEEAIKNVFGDKYRSLNPYEKLEECGLPWSKSQNWRIVHEMKFEDIENTDIGEFLKSI